MISYFHFHPIDYAFTISFQAYKQLDYSTSPFHHSLLAPTGLPRQTLQCLLDLDLS